MSHKIKYDENGEAYIGIEIEVRAYISEDLLSEMENDLPDDFEVFEMFSEMERTDLGEQVLNQLGKILDVDG
jgi:hypothetical protein